MPNFSEGRRPEVIEKIVSAIASAARVRVVDHSMDVDHNRAVVTFIGEPADVRKSMLEGARVAVDMIDLNQHTGGHPRIGAVDVIPVIPLSEITMEEAVSLAHQIGGDIADQLRVPIYFYERCAFREHCVNLADLRKGGYEALRASGLVDGREPDLGPSVLHPTAGATAVGARGPLIAFNVNLVSADIHAAHTIASGIRRLRDSGQAMAGVKAIAVLLRSRRIAQVSTNITQPHQTSVYEVYSYIEREARAMGIEVLESELIGALRQDAMTDTERASMKFREFSEKRVLDYWMRKFWE